MISELEGVGVQWYVVRKRIPWQLADADVDVLVLLGLPSRVLSHVDALIAASPFCDLDQKWLQFVRHSTLRHKCKHGHVIESLSVPFGEQTTASFHLRLRMWLGCACGWYWTFVASPSTDWILRRPNIAELAVIVDAVQDAQQACFALDAAVLKFE